jgi:sterol desaturase/sphingolipid hydroxylase (fatty acid hydroxylase superfamily)
VTAGWYLPAIAFVALALLERVEPTHGEAPQRADHLLNLAGLTVQGMVIPLAGYGIAQYVLAPLSPDWSGSLKLGWWGAFLLNVVVVDFLYYLQHRAFHAIDPLWRLHKCHHASPRVNVWATSRNTLVTNFLFVYLLVNPVLGFMCDAPEGFFFGAALTASLDLWRHAHLPERSSPAWLGALMITPLHHHQHHSTEGHRVNYGANLIIWDRIFGTARDPREYPARYGVRDAPSPWRQFLFPW